MELTKSVTIATVRRRRRGLNLIFEEYYFFLQVFILSYLFYYIFTKKAIVSFTIASFIIEPIRHYS